MLVRMGIHKEGYQDSQKELTVEELTWTKQKNEAPGVLEE